MPDQPFDGKPLDDLILVPDGKLAALRHDLQQDSAFSQLRADIVGLQIDIHTAIPSYMTQIHLLIQCRQPRVRVNPPWKSGQGRQGWKGHTRRDVATGPPLMRSLVVVVGEKCLCHFTHFFEGAGPMDL